MILSVNGRPISDWPRNRHQRNAALDGKVSGLKTEFARVSGFCYCFNMTATNVIEEIKHLPRAEQTRVIQFAFELASERQLPGKKLSELAQRMADSDAPRRS
jgi:hypothetical protein